MRFYSSRNNVDLIIASGNCLLTPAASSVSADVVVLVVVVVVIVALARLLCQHFVCNLLASVRREHVQRQQCWSSTVLLILPSPPPNWRSRLEIAVAVLFVVVVVMDPNSEPL